MSVNLYVTLVVLFLLLIVAGAMLALYSLADRLLEQNRDLAMQLAPTDGAVSGPVTLLGEVARSTAEAIGSAASAAQVPPAPAMTPDDIAAIYSHQLTADYTDLDQPDDTDPTDGFIVRERGEVAQVSPDDPNPFGVPGLGRVGVES